MADASLYDILMRLERTLAAVAETGAPFVNVPADPSLVTLLERVGKAALAPTEPSGPPAPVEDETPLATPSAPARSAAPRASGSPGTVPVGAAPGPARPLADIATLESLKFQYRNCQACGLAETRNRLVFGVGHAQPHIRS